MKKIDIDDYLKNNKSDLSIDKLYYAELDNFKPLKEEEQNKLLIRAKNGDKEAKKEFISRNLLLVIKIAGKYECKTMDKLDLIQEGSLGLMRAFELFDITKGYKFSTYAAWWINQKIILAISNKSRMIRVPIDTYTKVVELSKLKNEYQQKLGIELTNIEFSKIAHVDTTALEKYENLTGGIIPSLDVIIDEENTTLCELIPDNKTCVEENIENEIIVSAINSIMNKYLTSREIEILEKRFGLNNHTPMTLVEVGKECNISYERVRQIEAKALKKLEAKKKELVKKIY